jgi:hypothetical protein
MVSTNYLNMLSHETSNITSSIANRLKHLDMQQYPRSTFELKDNEFSHSLALPKTCTFDFTYATMFISSASSRHGVGLT